MTWPFSEEINSQLGTLERTRNRLRRAFSAAAIASLLCLVAAGGLLGGAEAFGPSETLAELDIPAAVASALSNENLGHSQGLPGSAMLALESFADTLMPALKIMSIVVLIGGIGLSLVNRGSMFTAPVILAFTLAGVVNLGLPLLQGISNGETAELASSARRIEQLGAHPQALNAKFRALGLFDSPDGRYVVAQAAVKSGARPLPGVVGQVAKELAAASLAVDPQILYALEMAAFGEPRSPYARTYAETARATAGWMVLSGKALVALGGLVGIACLAAHLIGHAISRRLGRIRSLASGNHCT